MVLQVTCVTPWVQIPCQLITDHSMFKIMYVIAYVLEPRSQNIVPNIKAVKIVNMSLTALYSVLRQ